MEEDGSNIVQVSVQGKQASPRLIRPDLDLIIVTARHEERLSLVEVNSSDRSIVLLKSVYESSHAVVPQLDGRGMKRDKDPWSLGVEGNAFCARGFGLELGEHRGVGSHGGLWGSLSSVHVLSTKYQA